MPNIKWITIHSTDLTGHSRTVPAIIFNPPQEENVNFLLNLKEIEFFVVEILSPTGRIYLDPTGLSQCRSWGPYKIRTHGQ